MVFEGVGVLFEPTKKKFEWTDAKKLMDGQFLNKLLCFDVSSITDDQLSRLTSIVARDECQPACVTNVSLACRCICLWLRAVLECANLQRQFAQQQTQ
jgi:hypothetical protein